MRNVVRALGLVLAAAALIATSGVALGQQDGETIHVYKSPT